MSTSVPAYVFQPHERPSLLGSPANPEHPHSRRILYFVIGVLLALTGALGNALVTVNLTSIQGTLGLYSDEAAWLSAAYVSVNVCANLVLVKFRQQYGLYRFVSVVLVSYALLTLAHLFIDRFETALLVRAASGLAAAGLSTLAIYYMLQSMPPARRLSGVVLAIGLPQLAVPLARVCSPELLYTGNWHMAYAFELGMALLALAAVTLLRLPPSDRQQVFERLDFLTLALFAPGISLLCAVLSQGRLLWWTEVAWLGYALIGAILLIGAALTVEHRRRNPLINTRWISSRDMVRFALVAVAVRILLSEQSYGSVGLLNAVGMGNDQMARLFAVVSLATLAGTLTGVFTLDTMKLGRPITIAVALIAVGAFIDAHANNLTRPANFYISQSLIAFATTFFMGSAMLIGMIRVLLQGPTHLVSFSVLFGITQNLGGLAGTALLGTFQILREKFHSHELVQSILMTDPVAAARLRGSGAALGRVIGDPTLRNAEGVVLLSRQVSREASILAFNDVFLITAVLACLTFIWVVFIQLRLWLSGTQPAAALLAERRKASAPQ